MKRTFSLLYPGMQDPMEVVERYVDEKRLRLVDLFMQVLGMRLCFRVGWVLSLLACGGFWQMDKDRDGFITDEEVTHAVDVLGLQLNRVQVSELMNRMDLDGDGTYVGRKLVFFSGRLLTPPLQA